MRPTFSVITANYNSGDKLAATLASVRQQQADAEHWIIDGVSTDGSLETARRLAEDDPKLRVVSQKDKGIYDALNYGISLATGRYLYFIGCGDTMLPGVLETVAARLPADDRTLVYGDTFWNGRRYAGPLTSRTLRLKNLPHQAAFYGREIFDLVGRYELKYRLLADWALNMAVFGDRRIRRKYVDIVVANYEGGGASDTQADPAFAADRALLEKRLGGWSALHAKLYDVGAHVKRFFVPRRPA